MKAAVIGAGLVGRSWAMVFARGGAEVAVWDQDSSQVSRALASISQSLKDMQQAGLIASAGDLRARIHAAQDLRGAVSGADHVQENIVEVAAPKQALFAEFEKYAPADAVLPVRPRPSCRRSCLRICHRAPAVWWRIRSIHRIWHQLLNCAGRPSPMAMQWRAPPDS